MKMLRKCKETYVNYEQRKGILVISHEELIFDQMLIKLSANLCSEI